MTQRVWITIGAAIAVVAASIAIWWSVVAGRLSPDTPLLADFRVFCVDTEAQRGAVIVAAAGRSGMEEIPQEETSHQLGVMNEWVHTTDGHSTNISIATPPNPEDLGVIGSVCRVSDLADNQKSRIAIQRWLGKPTAIESSVPGVEMEVYIFMLKDGRASRLGRQASKLGNTSSNGGAQYWVEAIFDSKSTNLALVKQVHAIHSGLTGDRPRKP